MLKSLMRSIANTIDSIAYRVFGCESKQRKIASAGNEKRHRALLIISKKVGCNYDFDYLEDE